MNVWQFIDLHPVLSVIFALLALCGVGAIADGIKGRRIVHRVSGCGNITTCEKCRAAWKAGE